jgi:hypothetical protein
MGRITVWAAPIFFADVIWSAVSLHAWLYLSSSIAIVCSLRGLIRLTFGRLFSGTP